MSWIDRNLLAGESVFYRARLHWVVMFRTLLLGTALDLAGLGLLVFAFLKRNPTGEAPAALVAIGIALLFLASVVMVVGFVRRSATEITVTNRRVVIKTGIASRRTTEVLLSKVESVDVEESLMGRMLGFGTVTVRGTGGTPEPFERIAKPLEFRRQVQSQIEESSIRSARTA